MSAKFAIIWLIESLIPGDLEVAGWGPQGAVLISRNPPPAPHDNPPAS
jgi:hypothetical protein